MPELPEVETMRRGAAAIVGSRIRAVVRPGCRLRPIEIGPSWSAFRRRVTGQTIVELGRAGKRVVLRLESGDAIVVEPRMAGLLLLADPPTSAHLRLRFELEGGPAAELLYWDRRGLGSVRVVDPTEFVARYGPEQLGPDALRISAAELRDRLAPSRREIKVALLDQHAVAGIGNLYASEILHLAGIHPRRRCSDLSRADWNRLHAAAREVLEAAIRYEGSTLADGTYRNAQNRAGDYQNHHRVYARAGETCTRCGRAEIARVVQAQRSTFFCPHCQPAHPAASRRRRG